MWPLRKREMSLDRAALNRVSELVHQVSELEKVMRRLCDDVEDLDQRYTKMRGLIYAKKLHKAPEDEAMEEETNKQTTDVSKMTRAELKAHLTRSGRFIPGQPAKHTE